MPPVNQQRAQEIDMYAKQKAKRMRPWDEWPEDLKLEIEYILSQKDAGNPLYSEFSVVHMRTWAAEQHKIRLSDMQIRRYATDALGRKGWATP